jgi:hypothetical protein
MNTRQLRTLPDARELASVGSAHAYARSHGINTYGIAVYSEIDQIRSQQGMAFYVGSLVLKLQRCVPLQDGTGFKVVRHLAHTGLSTLFADRYDLDMSPFHDNPDGFTLQAITTRNSGNAFHMYYGVEDPALGNPHYQLTLDADYGFVNMFCTGDTSKLPLAGEANVTFVPGIEAALRTDIELFADRPPLTSPAA